MDNNNGSFDNVAKNNCMICGSPLKYYTKETKLECYYCGSQYSGYVSCPNGHAVCDKCHNRPAIELTKNICNNIKSTNPIEIFNKILESKNITMLGCHHAFMVAGSIMTAIKNTEKIDIREDQFEELFSRIEKQAISGYCGLTGLCGIAPAVGACFSIILGAKCGTDMEQKIVMQVVAEVCSEIAALTGPSCCKAYSWRAIEIAQRHIQKELDITLSMPSNEIICNYSELHPHGCRKNKCPYFRNG